MWIHNKNIFLKIVFKHQNDGSNLDVKFLDENFNLIKFENLSRIDSNIQTVCTWIDMPTTIYLVIEQDSFMPTTVTDISLGNIPFDNTLISQIFEYKMNYDQKNYSPDQLINLGSHRTTDLAYSGMMCFNFFDTNPISYHMHLGNKIWACNSLAGRLVH